MSRLREIVFSGRLCFEKVLSGFGGYMVSRVIPNRFFGNRIKINRLFRRKFEKSNGTCPEVFPAV
jgi:hypothetical protein